MTTTTNKPGLPRRRFLVYSTGALTACASFGCSNENAVGRLSEDVDIRLSDYPELEVIGQTVTIEVDQLGLPVAVTRQSTSGTFIVTGTECNHEGCGVVRNGDHWRCPCHGAEFELSGDLRKGPATKGLGPYDYEIVDGVLTVFGEG